MEGQPPNAGHPRHPLHGTFLVQGIVLSILAGGVSCSGSGGGGGGCGEGGGGCGTPLSHPVKFGTYTTADRSQGLAPGISNQGGGLIVPFVNLWSGNLVLDYPAVSVPAVGLDWELHLHYNALLSSETTTLGPGWRHSYEIALLLGTPEPTSITMRWGDGRRDIFVQDANGWSGPPALHAMRITQVSGGYELRDKHGLVHVFDAAGLLVARRDRNGNTMALTYAAGRLSTVTDVPGRSCQFHYNSQGKLVSITGLQHPSPLITLEYQGNLLVRVRDVAGNPCDFAYDSNQLLESITDPDGDGIALDYQASLPVVVRVTTTDGAERRFAYDQSLLETTVIDVIAQGQESVTRYRFDALGRIVSVTDGPLATTQNTYDAANNLLTHTDAGGHMTSMTYSAEGDLLTITDPTQAARSYTYDPVFHLVMSVMDEGMNTWGAQRDPSNGNLTRWTDPLGNHDDYTYNMQGLVTSHTDRRGNPTTFAYNTNGDLVQVIDAAGKTITATYNPRGMPLSITDEENHTAIATLTSRDEIATVTLPGGELYTLAWIPSRMLASITDPRGAEVSFVYNDRKQLTSHTDALGFTANLVRDGAGFVTRAINALGSSTDYDRDLAGRLVAIRDPDGGVASFVRDCCDVLSRTDALGTVSYGHTNRHELASITGTDLAIQYTWDPRRLLAAANQSVPSPQVGYVIGRDAAGRTTSVQATHLGPRISMLVLDSEGNPVQVTTNLNPTPVLMTYNNLNLPASVTAGSPALTATVTYSPRRQVSQIAYSSGVGASYSYDQDGQLTAIQEQGSSFSASYGAGYDASGNRNSVAVNLPVLGSGNIQVNYELRGLPSTVVYSPGGTTTLTYNQVRDRLQLVGPNGTVSYSYTGAQRMIGAGQTMLAWNFAGGCTQLVRPGSTTTFAYRTDGALNAITQQSQSWQLVLGPLGEIARVVLPGGASRWFAYDFADRGGLIRRVIMNAPGGGATDSFIYASGIGDRASAPPPVGAAAAPIMWLKSPASQANQRATLTDPWGSVSLVADGLGNMLQARVYGIFGEPLAQTSGSQYVVHGYLGMDAEEALSDLLFLGLSAGELSGVIAMSPLPPSGVVPTHGGAPALYPYLPETASLLYDQGFGSDGLYAGAGGASGQEVFAGLNELAEIFMRPMLRSENRPVWGARIRSTNRPAEDDESNFGIQGATSGHHHASSSMADALKKLKEALNSLMGGSGG